MEASTKTRLTPHETETSPVKYPSTPPGVYTGDGNQFLPPYLELKDRGHYRTQFQEAWRRSISGPSRMTWLPEGIFNETVFSR